MKIKRMQVLPILVVGGIAASCYGVINYINSSKSSFAAERRAIISANVEGMPDSITPNTITPTLKIGVSVSERVSSGDRVEFCTYGFGAINYGNVSLSSGEVIGTISAIGNKVKYRRNIQGDLSDNTSNRLELDKGGNDLCYAIQFNQNAEKYDNISGVQIASSAYVLFPMSSQDYTYRMRVVDGEDTEVYGKDVVVKATPYVSPQENQALAISSYYLRNENGQISGRSIPSIYMKTGTSLPVGSTIKYQLGQGGLEYYNLFTEGSIISFDRNKNRVYAEYDTINNNDIYVLKDLGAKRFKVVSHTASEIVLETMDVIEGGIHYNYSDGLTGRELKIQLVDPSKLSEGSNRLNPIETNSVVIDGLTSAEIFNQKREGTYDYTGQTISPAEASLRRGTVLAKYVDEAGREISNQKTVSNNQPFGTQYNDTEIQITGYTFSRLGAGSAPKQGTVNGSTQTITYVYTQQRGTVLAKYVDEAGREISNQKTVSNNQPFGTQYNDTEIQITGYTFSRLGAGSAPKQGTVNGSTQTITYVYTQQRGTVLAKYVDEAGREISNQKTVSNNQPFGTQYNDTEIQITGYTFSRLGAGSAPKQGTVNGSTQTITYVYTQQRGTVLAKYVDEAGREISNQKTVSNNQPFGTQYNDTEIQITGYTFSRLGAGSAPKQGTVNGSTQTITYVYTQQRGTVLAKYVDEAGREISNQKTVSNNQPFGTQYNDTEIQITGYTFSRLGAGSAPKQGTVNGSTQTITYVYTQQRGTVLAKYVDEAGREISNQKTVSNNQPFGTRYTVANPDKIPGYRYVGLTPNSAPQNGTVNGGTQTIIFKFEKIQVTPKTQTIKVGETPDPKVHIPNFDQDFAGCKVEYKEPVDSSTPGVVDVKLIISCPGQENREVDSKVYVVGGNDIGIPVGKTPNPKDHITDFDEKFPGCEVRYKNKVDTTKVGTVDATIIISCPGEDEKEVDVKIHITPVPTVPQTIKVGETPDPKLHIPNFEEHFPGCDARYKTQPDISKAGRIDVVIVVTCDDREIEIHSHLIIEELPAQVKAPNTGSASGILPAAIATISAIVSATAIFFKKK